MAGGDTHLGFVPPEQAQVRPFTWMCTPALALRRILIGTALIQVAKPLAVTGYQEPANGPIGSPTDLVGVSRFLLQIAWPQFLHMRLSSSALGCAGLID